MADIISGTEMRAAILDELRQEVEAIREKHGTVPGLVTILVGENPASISYVTLKVKTALSLGFHEIQDNQPADISEEALLALIDKYNRDPSIHGILVQLPLPKHIDENKVIYAIDPDKDVDGFHPVNLGRMVIGGDAVRFLPCTPAGIQEMLVRSGVEMAGAEVVVVGRSNIVGKPISVMLGQKGPGANATVTMVHTRTKDLAEHCRRADILIVAAGVPGLVKPDWIKPGATVIDVGVNRVGFAITDDAVVREAAIQEVIRRYFRYQCEYVMGVADQQTVDRVKLLMDDLGVSETDRPTVLNARETAKAAASTPGKGNDGFYCGAALQLPDQTVIAGKNSPLLHAAASCILNTIKHLAGLPDELLLLSPEVIDSVGSLKKEILRSKRLSLDLDETLIALSVSVPSNPAANLAMKQLKRLAGCEMHLSHLPTPGDEAGLRKLGINLTSDPVFAGRDLFVD